MQIYIFALIDYVKILVKDVDIDRLRNKLKFYRNICVDTSEYETKQVAKYHHCKITIFDSGTVMFSGSIHKLWNSRNGCFAPSYKQNKANHKGFNGNLFSLNDIVEVMKHLQDLFDCKPQQMIFKNIELGVNLEVDFTPNKFLWGLLYHCGKIFESSYNRNLFKVDHQQYEIKIYNKGRQYSMRDKVLRFEVKYSKMLQVNAIGIKTFNDINKTTIEKARELILERFDEVMYYDRTIDKKQLKKRELVLLEKYSNQRYWVDGLSSNHRDRHKKKLKEMIIKYSDNLHQKIRGEMIKKCVLINRMTRH